MATARPHWDRAETPEQRGEGERCFILLYTLYSVSRRSAAALVSGQLVYCSEVEIILSHLVQILQRQQVLNAAAVSLTSAAMEEERGLFYLTTSPLAVETAHFTFPNSALHPERHTCRLVLELRTWTFLESIMLPFSCQEV